MTISDHLSPDVNLTKSFSDFLCNQVNSEIVNSRLRNILNPDDSDGKESAGNAREPGSIPGSGRSSGEGDGYLFQYSYLKNPMHRGAWQAPVCWVTKLEITEQLTFSDHNILTQN